MLRDGKYAKVKVKDNKHDDAFATFAQFLFGDPIGNVDSIKFNEEGVTAKCAPPNFTEYNKVYTERKKRSTPSWWDTRKANPFFMDFPTPIVINIEELKEIQCSVCKAKMQPNAELHYVAISPKRINPFYTSEEALHDAYDCPLCGSQILLGQRLERLK